MYAQKLFQKTPNIFFLGLITLFIFSSCKKDATISQPNLLKTFEKGKLPQTINPYSLRNVEKAKASISARRSLNPQLLNVTSNEELPQYIYFKFDPNDLSQGLFQSLENDSTVRLMDFPFANAAIYNDEYALDEEKAEKLKDGNIYGVTNIENPLIDSILQISQSLDTLVLIPEEDTTLQFQAMQEAGYSEEQLTALRLRICLLKRPSGRVTYWDAELPDAFGVQGIQEPVRNIQVWGFVFGIPLHTYTDVNGNYQFPWRFSIGGIMGTHAKNSRVTVKPFNTIGNWYQVIPQLLINFIVGSVYVRGWVSSCDMRNDVNFEFTDHRQNRYWAQILNAYNLHDVYTDQDRIMNAPQNMICYAHWADDPDFGSASTPMLYHMTGRQFTDDFLQVIFGNPVTGQLLSIFHRMLPDMTFKVCGTTEPQFYNSRLAQIAFHELGHASQYRQVGPIWYLEFAIAELFHVNSNTGYGTPGYSGWGKVQVGESWAEFIGTQHAVYRYGALGIKNSAMLGLTTDVRALEEEDWFSNDWIPGGVYFDLIDGVNALPAEDPWDQVHGSSIQDMFNVFDSHISDMCEYRVAFLNMYPQFSPANVGILFARYNLQCN